MNKYRNTNDIDIYSITNVMDTLIRAYGIGDEEVKKEVKIKLLELIKEL